MYSVALEPPLRMIPLSDPFVEFFSGNVTLTKDLFFSGHTATLFLLYILSEKKIIKNLLLISNILVAIGLLFQHAHYSIDILSAPFFSYGVYRLILLKENKKEKLFFNKSKYIP